MLSLLIEALGEQLKKIDRQVKTYKAIGKAGAATMTDLMQNKMSLTTVFQKVENIKDSSDPDFA